LNNHYPRAARQHQLLACDPISGGVRRFLTGPVNCEITGATWTPDGRTMFINSEHPVRGGRPKRPGQPAALIQLARRQPDRPAALGDAGGPQRRLGEMEVEDCGGVDFPCIWRREMVEVPRKLLIHMEWPGSCCTSRQAE
jgi:hypothetical protein